MKIIINQVFLEGDLMSFNTLLLLRHMINFSI